ncbi:hypothetical protein CcI49_02915 [Frankia sp. CcI49]|nr:hypothetical protein CcI49_02915 [Frankia sp. CcI49]
MDRLKRAILVKANDLGIRQVTDAAFTSSEIAIIDHNRRERMGGDLYDEEASHIIRRIDQGSDSDFHWGITAVQSGRVDSLGEPGEFDRHNSDAAAEVILVDAHDEYASIESEGSEVLSHLALSGVGLLVGQL